MARCVSSSNLTSGQGPPTGNCLQALPLLAASALELWMRRPRLCLLVARTEKNWRLHPPVEKQRPVDSSIVSAATPESLP
mmetsp:Transcript_59678/g.106445  ORF Transcript_59678/g.106445 Transcript_59678/m.106445 type:complete len:80 (-) Transcript_59678:455-694(-)